MDGFYAPFYKNIMNDFLEEIDLFADYDNLPENVKLLLDEFHEKYESCEYDSYELCSQLVTSLELIGYTCEYGLDAEPYNLRLIDSN
jgi:hypothetical protein